MDEVESTTPNFPVRMSASGPAQDNQSAGILRDHGDVCRRHAQADSLNPSELFRRQVDPEEVRLLWIGQIPQRLQIHRREIAASGSAARLQPNLVTQEEQEDDGQDGQSNNRNYCHRTLPNSTAHLRASLKDPTSAHEVNSSCTRAKNSQIKTAT